MKIVKKIIIQWMFDVNVGTQTKNFRVIFNLLGLLTDYYSTVEFQRSQLHTSTRWPVEIRQNYYDMTKFFLQRICLTYKYYSRYDGASSCNLVGIPKIGTRSYVTSQ